MISSKGIIPFHSILADGFRSPFTLHRQLKESINDDMSSLDRMSLDTEVQCFGYYIEKGTLIPYHNIGLAVTQSESAISNHKDFSEKQWRYIEDRLRTAQHPFLTARYAHLLWMKGKHNQYAKQAIIAYRSLSDLYLEAKDLDEERFLLFTLMVECYHHISSATKQEIEECKLQLISWLNTSTIPTTWKQNMVEIVAGSPLFKSSDLKGLTQSLLSQIKEEKYSYTLTKDVLHALLKLAQKEKGSKEEVLELLGENELLLASERESDQTGMVPTISYQRAAVYFKQAGNKEKMQAALIKYSENKRKVKLGVVRVEDSGEEVQAWNKKLNDLIDYLLKEDPEFPFIFLAIHESFLPKDMTDEEAIEQLKGHLRYLLNVEAFDRNNNSKVLTQAEKIAAYKFDCYCVQFQMGGLEIMNRLFQEGIKAGSITRESYMAYFEKTWLAMPLERISINVTPLHYSWMELLEPGLNELFTQLEKDVQKAEQKPNYLLAIDSLTLKLEGIIRDYAMLASIPVTKIKENESLELNLEELLSEPNIQDLFTDEDILLWRMILTKRGWNQRNDTAHAFYRPQDYSRNKALNLLLCLYRISKYKVHKRSD